MSEEMENTEQRMWRREQEFRSFKDYIVSKVGALEEKVKRLEVKRK